MENIWQALKENWLFLVNYRKNMRRLRDEQSDLEIKMQLAQIELTFAMIEETRQKKK